MRTLAAMALLIASPCVFAADLGVTELFEKLAQHKPSRATFVEKKYLSLLDKPVESRGELTFTPPGRLEKRTIAPRPERVLVDGDRLTLERGGKRYSMGLQDQPGVAVLVESIRATLAGDLQGLTRTYSARVAGDSARWKLTLHPLDPAVSTLVERLDIGGEDARVLTVEIFQKDGDRSVMTLSEAGA